MDWRSEDRRDGKRFKLRLPCAVISPSRQFERINGTTSDISRTGVRVVFPDKTVLSSFHPGDIVSIDIPKRTLTLEVAEEEIARRRTAWQRPARDYSGVLRRYVAFVSGAETGAVLSGGDSTL